MGFSHLSRPSHSQRSSAWVQNPGKLRGKLIPSSPTLPDLGIHCWEYQIPKFPKIPADSGLLSTPFLLSLSHHSKPNPSFPLCSREPGAAFPFLWECETRSTLRKNSWLSSLLPVFFIPAFLNCFSEHSEFPSPRDPWSDSVIPCSGSGFVPRIPNIPIRLNIPIYPNIPKLDFSAVLTFPLNSSFISREIPIRASHPCPGGGFQGFSWNDASSRMQGIESGISWISVSILQLSPGIWIFPWIAKGRLQHSQIQSLGNS